MENDTESTHGNYRLWSQTFDQLMNILFQFGLAQELLEDPMHASGGGSARALTALL